MSGGGATSPFTTPNAACSPLPGCADTATSPCWNAGSTDTYIREYFLARGYSVFTAPSTIGVGVASADDSWGGFVDCAAPPLPSYMTVNNAGDIDFAGASLVSFLLHLRDAYGVRELDIIAHSMGGLYSRSALRSLKERGWPVRVRSLTTIGTPWMGVWEADMAASYLGAKGLVSVADCQGDAFCLATFEGFVDAATASMAIGPGILLTTEYMRMWNALPVNAGVLDGIAVNIFGGGGFVAPNPANASDWVWPNDGLPSLRSALARDVSEAALPRTSVRINATFPSNLHSTFFTRLAQRPIEEALTFNPEVMALIDAALKKLGP